MNMVMTMLPVFIIGAAVLSLYFSQAKPRDTIWFGVTLPKKALKDKRLLELQGQYLRSYRIFAAIILTAALPLLLLASMPFLSYIYLAFWTVGVLYAASIPFKRYHFLTTQLKREKNWFSESKREINIQPEIDRLTAMKPISPYWFLLPALISCGLIFISIRGAEGLLRLAGFASFGMTAVMFLLYLSFGKGKPRSQGKGAVSATALHNAGKRYWSIMWLVLAVFEAVNAVIAYYVLLEGVSSDFGIWIGGILMISLIPVCVIFAVYNKIRDLEYRYAGTDGKSYINDDDEHWRNGSTYFNPDDPSVLVPKRVGAGSTVNMATRRGKQLLYGASTGAAAIVIIVLVLLGRGDAMAPAMTLADDGNVSITNTDYPYSFNMGDVLDIKLEEQLPSGFRSNGVATSLYARGNFDLSELGAAKLYVFKKTPPYILIKLPDMHVVFNDESPEQTRLLYEELASRLAESP